MAKVSGRILLVSLWAMVLCQPLPTLAADEAPAPQGQERSLTPEQQAVIQKLQSLNWVKGPTTVEVVGNSKLDIPAGFAFLNQADTSKFLELNHNLSDGKEMMIAPESLEWSAYLSFADEGYVKDDEKIDPDALLKSMKEGTEAANAQRRERGWGELHVTGWAIPPAYNSSTKRLEWATDLQSDGGRNVNFFTKILGRRGHTSVVLVAQNENLQTSVASLNGILGSYRFNAGDTYAEYKPGDKVAEYGLAALVLGGAAAIATKKGFWAVLAGFFAAAWKFLMVGVVAAGAWLKKLFGKKETA